jgi:hypothetical protein
MTRASGARALSGFKWGGLSAVANVRLRARLSWARA